MNPTRSDGSTVATDLSIVIVSWNVRTLLLSCLESIAKNSGLLGVETIVVDNNSRDGSVEAVKADHPDVHLISNDQNFGFAVATNQGMRIARARNILLLNPDTEVLEGALTALVDFADRHPETTGLVGPMLINPSGSIQYTCARRLPTLYDWYCRYIFLDRLFPRSRLFGRLLLSWWDHQDSRPVECLSGACMLVPTKVVKQIGLLDDEYPMYVEDIWYCARTRAAGYENYYLSEAKVLHHGGQSAIQTGSATGIVSLEAFRRHLGRFASRPERMLFAPLILLAQPLRIAAFAVLALLNRARWAAARRELAVLTWAFRGMPSEPGRCAPKPPSSVSVKR